MKRRPEVLLGLVLGLAAVHLVPARAQAPVAGPASPAGAHAAPSKVAAAHGPEAVRHLLIALVVILVGAKLGAEAFERLGQPAVLGEILFGIGAGNLGLVGIHGLEFIPGSPEVSALAELGVILLLFEVGLESDLQEMRRVGLSSFAVAALGVIAPGALGFGVSRWFLPDEPALVHLFVGTILCATSVGITARVLRDLGQLQRPEARIILGAAVIDDVMGLLVLAVISGLITAAATGATLGGGAIALILVKAVGFLGLALLLGSLVSPRLFRMASYLNVRHMLLVTSFAFCFLLAWLAAEIQLAPIVGAFAAGLILDPVHYRDFLDRGEHRVEELIHPITGFLVPIFFVYSGMNVDLSALGNAGALGFAAVLTLAAIAGKQLCALGVLQRGLDRLSVGIGMIPRGEVGLIFANAGLTLTLPTAGGALEPVVQPATFSAAVIVVMVTTLVTPPLLRWSLCRSRPGAAG